MLDLGWRSIILASHRPLFSVFMTETTKISHGYWNFSVAAPAEHCGDKQYRQPRRPGTSWTLQMSTDFLFTELHVFFTK